jgi:Rab3 GTPase-activating protein catalytic subunit
MERQHVDKLEHDFVSVLEQKELKGATPSVASTVVVNNATGQIDEPWSPTSGTESPTRMTTPSGNRINHNNVPMVDTLPNKRSFGAIAESPEEEHHSHSRDGSSKQEFYDAEEGRSLLGSVGDDGSVNADHTTSVAQRQSRRGARCPVHGVSLVASGDQLYAPYLQRPLPVTDDVILTRRQMLSRHRSCKLLKSQDRLEIAHRLQTPKLLSDMRAFKAANPGSVFQDFINWYGNPGNPLEDYGEESETDSLPPNDSNNMSMTVKLDHASEAIQILTATRDFFSNTWDEATPCAAMDQEPLFDAFSTVEMVLDSFETMHPASLVNQIMAVNLSTAYFTLVSSAGDALHVGMVTSALKELREKTEHALRLLARDVTYGTFPEVDFQDILDRLPKHASLEAIRACDAACNSLSIAEASVARTISILHKFPRQYDLVQNMLRRADSEPLVLENAQGRSGILHVIHKQQAVADTLPVPSLREYILRNTDENNPCQLCVRFGDEGAFEGIGAEGGVMVALTKSCRD